MRRLRAWLSDRLDARSWWVVLLMMVVLALGAGVTLGLVSTLVMLGFWPFYKLTAWLLL